MSKGAVAEAPIKGVLKELPVDKLYESKANPRVIVDDVAQQELNDDVGRRGILTALIVRPVNGKYEILAGARRFAAAKRNRLKTVPTRVIECDDATAHEIMVVENLQRKDIHPLDEAKNFQIILDRNNGDVLALAKRVNKKPAYIQRVLVLNNIVPRFRDWFRKGTVERDAAFCLARLTPADQERYYTDLEGGDKKAQSVSVSDVQDWTIRNVLRELDRVPWDVKDATLVPKAGGCATCPKRTGISKDMFSDVSRGDSCTDGACFTEKLKAHMARMEGKLGSPGVHFWYITKHDYESSGEGQKRILGTKDYLETTFDKKCESLTKGLVVKGQGVGTTIWICVNPRCKVHRLSLGNHGARVSASEAEKIKDEKRERIKEGKVRDRLLTAVVNKVTMGLGTKDMEVIATVFFSRLWHEHKKRLLKRHGLIKPPSKVKVEAPPDYDDLFRKEWSGMDGPKFAKVLVEMALIDDVEPGPMDLAGENLYEAGKRYKVDVKEIKDIVTEEERQAALPKKSKQKK